MFKFVYLPKKCELQIWPACFTFLFHCWALAGRDGQRDVTKKIVDFTETFPAASFLCNPCDSCRRGQGSSLPYYKHKCFKHRFSAVLKTWLKDFTRPCAMRYSF